MKEESISVDRIRAALEEMDLCARHKDVEAAEHLAAELEKG